MAAPSGNSYVSFRLRRIPVSQEPMSLNRQLIAGPLLLIVGMLSARQPAPAARAWTMLEQGVADKSEDTRQRAVEALGLLIKDNRARTLAEGRLHDDSPPVRAAGATSLGQIGLKAASPALTAALHDKEAGVVFASASALLVLGDQTAYRVYYAVLTGERKTGEPLLESQLKMLKDPQALARVGFEQGIGFIPFGGIGLTVFKSFHADSVSPVRAAAAQRLARDPDPASGRALVKAASDEKWLVRASAVSALAVRGDPSLESAVVPRLDDENETVRFTAAAAIVRLESGATR
jgi:HEAT repeat protein